MGIVGAYGKMPGLGDFFRINARAGFVASWDAWLQTGLATVRGALAGRWQGCYMSAPIWRFTLEPAVAGRMAAQGVLMPSIDRVGRTFPLTLMWPGPRGGLAAHLEATPFFERLEDIALGTLDGCPRAALAAEITPLIPVTDPDAILPAAPLAAGLDPASPRARTIWTAELEGETRLLACRGLPEGPEMLGLFDLDAPIWPQPETGGAHEHPAP